MIGQNSCNPFGPDIREAYQLVRLNGSLLPANLEDYVLQDGRRYENRIPGSSLVLYDNGRFIWTVQQVILLDGKTDPAFPLTGARVKGDYEIGGGAATLSWFFKGTYRGDTLSLQDISGTYSYSTWDFVPRR